ncbi:hypothetical protein O6H91_15G055800 [Diphasiastrum complanatum]|uniref:Uncharacterized protein n=1 Tax=Diphasiastrum complanatum TaxID=34168 RepID=A0ACC2BIK4_DIPCM|nr:hypothetical protein O6H91_15G055800 [Diphasiastrum complanatum]
MAIVSCVAHEKTISDKFSVDQKEKMCIFAEKLGWRIQKTMRLLCSSSVLMLVSSAMSSKYGCTITSTRLERSLCPVFPLLTLLSYSIPFQQSQSPATPVSQLAQSDSPSFLLYGELMNTWLVQTKVQLTSFSF